MAVTGARLTFDLFRLKRIHRISCMAVIFLSVSAGLMFHPTGKCDEMLPNLPLMSLQVSTHNLAERIIR